jgi:acyl-coenzyme A synthetase/AMP-(fatty) acid ligase
LYFVGRTDEMVKTSGYRVSPTEVEEVLYQSGWVTEAVVVGVPDAALGARLKAVVVAAQADASTPGLLDHCRRELPAFMVPHEVLWVPGPLPRSPNGKLDRQHWRTP